MKEIRDIIRAFAQAQQQGKTCALATVVYVNGSSYRRAGARMLIDSDGHITGAISGGCLEGDALKKAQLVMMQQRAMLVTYDTRDEDDARLGMGLGCSGIIHVLIEPVQPADTHHPIVYLKQLSEKRQYSVLVTVFEPEARKNTQPGTCFLLKEDGSVFGHATSLDSQLAGKARDALRRKTSSFETCMTEDRCFTAFFQVVPPAVSLVILGAGNDTLPVVALADVLGWEISVMDGRPAYATVQRFSTTSRVWVRKPAEILDGLRVDQQTVFLLMTHNYHYDMAALRLLVGTDTPYIGMLGPKKKFERMLQEIKEEGIELTNDQMKILHTPAGLDIGAETPEEIALSIIAEISAILAGKTARPLKDHPGTIHERSVPLPQ